MITFSNVTPAQFAGLKKRLAESHDAIMNLDASGTTGTVTGHDVTASIAYSGSTSVLSVAVIKHPFWYPLSAIEQGISTSINKALEAECS